MADHAAKRRILKILSLNWTLEGKTLVLNSGSRSTYTLEASPELRLEVVTQKLPSWNQVSAWLRELNGLRTAMKMAGEGRSPTRNELLD